MLCFTVQGRNYSSFNLVSSNEFLINAKFVPDSKREGVTWMGSIGVIFKTTLNYGGHKINHFNFDARSHTVQIGDAVSLDMSTIQAISSDNRSITITETNHWAPPHHHPHINFHLKDVGLRFTILVDDEHLDTLWHSPIEGSNAHGLIGKFKTYGPKGLN